MSILEKIKGIEDCIIEISDNQKVILEALENNKEKLDRLLAKGTIIKEEVSGEEWVERLEKVTSGEKEEVQDLVEVLLMKQTEKAFLVVKHGFQVWVAKSHLEDPEGYDIGNTYDLKIKEKSKWILEKLDWKPFEVFKG